MNNKIISCFALSSFLLFNTSVLSFNLDKMGWDIEVGFKVKDY